MVGGQGRVAGVSEEELKAEASQRGAERNKRRRQFDPDIIAGQLDHRKTAHPGFKHARLQITMTQDCLGMVDAVRMRLNYGRGMSRSEFLEMTARYWMEKRPEAHDARRAWRERQENTQGGEE